MNQYDDPLAAAMKSGGIKVVHKENVSYDMYNSSGKKLGDMKEADIAKMNKVPRDEISSSVLKEGNYKKNNVTYVPYGTKIDESVERADQDLSEAVAESEETNYVISFQKGRTVGARSVRMVHVAASDDTDAMKKAEVKYKSTYGSTPKAEGYGLNRVKKIGGKSYGLGEDVEQIDEAEKDYSSSKMTQAVNRAEKDRQKRLARVRALKAKGLNDEQIKAKTGLRDWEFKEDAERTSMDSVLQELSKATLKRYVSGQRKREFYNEGMGLTVTTRADMDDYRSTFSVRGTNKNYIRTVKVAAKDEGEARIKALAVLKRSGSKGRNSLDGPWVLDNIQKLNESKGSAPKKPTKQMANDGYGKYVDPRKEKKFFRKSGMDDPLYLAHLAGTHASTSSKKRDKINPYPKGKRHDNFERAKADTAVEKFNTAVNRAIKKSDNRVD